MFRVTTKNLVLVLIGAVLLPLGGQRLAAQESTSTNTSSSVSSGSTTTSEQGATDTTLAPPATTSEGTSLPPAVTATSGPALQGGPSGTGVFSRTPVQIHTSLSGGYDDNVSNTPNTNQSSAFTSGDVILDYTFGDPRLQLTLNGGAGATYYFSHLSSQDYDIDLKGALAITYKESPRLTLGGTILVSYLTEPTFQYAGGINSRNGNYLYTDDKLFFEYLWSGRFSTRTSYNFEAYNYDKNSIGTFSNRVSNIFDNEFRLQLVPTTKLILEYRYGIVSYENSFLDSETHYVLGGFDHTFNPRLSATFRGGLEFRSYDNAGDRTAPYFESNVNYTLGRRTSVGWLTRYGLEEPDTPNSQSRTTFRTGLQTKFSLTSRIETGLDLFYVHDDYHTLTPGTGGAFSEDTFDTGFSFRYAITSLIGVQVGYHYTDISSDAASREYSRDRVYAGINVTF